MKDASWGRESASSKEYETVFWSGGCVTQTEEMFFHCAGVQVLSCAWVRLAAW
jgi:hypothetical protein